MQDDPSQSPKASALMESLSSDKPGFIPLVCVVELFWVFSTCYDLTDQQMKHALEALLRTKEIVVERADLVLKALRVFGDGKADFADCLMERTADSAGCNRTMTFDVGAAKHTGMTLIR